VNYFIAVDLFLIVLYIDLTTDYQKWKNNISVNHLIGAIIRLLGLLPAILITPWTFWPLMGFSYWFLFDGIYNKLRRFDWWFTGSNDKDDALTDNLLQRMSIEQQIYLKGGGILISIAVFVMYLV
jgi:hypothetical protein